MDMHEEYPCPHCKSVYKYDQSLQRHISKAHNESHNNLDCIENINVKSISNDTDGAQTAYLYRFFDCSYCNHKYKSNTLLQSHINKCHPEKSVDDVENEDIQYFQKTVSSELDGEFSQLKEYICKICKKIYSKESYVRRHIRERHNETVYECNICNKGFNSLWYVKKHQRTLHSVINNEYLYSKTKRLTINEGFVYECNICDQVYELKFNLEKHQRELHSDIYDENLTAKKKKITINEGRSVSTIDRRVECKLCNRKCATNSTLKEHMKRLHFIKPEKSIPKIQCCENDCGVSVNTLHQLRLHLESCIEDGGHNVIIEEEEKIFDNIQEFNQWKGNIEVEENTRYSGKRSPKLQKDGSYKRIYYCNRSGYYRSKGTGKRPNRGSSKMGGYCPSTIDISCTSNGTVKCKYFKTHRSHETSGPSQMHIRIHQRDKIFIADCIGRGVDIQNILEDLHAKGGRSGYIKRQDILNIKRRLVGEDDRIY